MIGESDIERVHLVLYAVCRCIKEPPAAVVEERSRVDRNMVELNDVRGLPPRWKIGGTVEGKSSGPMSLGKHPGFALCLKDDRVGEMPRLGQYDLSVEELQIIIIDQHFDCADAYAVVVGLDEQIQMPVPPQSKGIGEELKRFHWRQPAQVYRVQSARQNVLDRRAGDGRTPDVLA